MEVIPSIDLRDGLVVHLRQGDYRQQTIYDRDPAAVARRFEAAGVPRVHVVDLDGALAGASVQLPACQRIVESVRIPVQLGGGLRTADAIDRAIAVGVDRVVLGTAAATDHALVQQALGRCGAARIVIGLDARDGLIAVRGWTEATAFTAQQLMSATSALGVERFIYTDISRDGTLTGPNFAAVSAMVKHSGSLGRGVPALVASGGVGSLEHLTRLASIGVEGAIVGSAVYTGAIDLAAVVQAVGKGPRDW